MRLSEREFAEVRERLYPLLMDPVQIQEKGQGSMVNGVLAEGLVAIYGIEEPDDKIRYVSYQDLRDWGISHNVLHITAVRNLERLTRGKRITKLDMSEGGRPMFIWHLEDGFDAARILLAEWLNDLAEAVTGHLILGVPHRNWMVALGDTDEELVKAVRIRVFEEHRVADFPVSPYLYTWTEGSLQRYREPRS